MPLAAFDIEIAKEIPDDDCDWLRHGPIGISCAAFIREGADTTPLVMFDPRRSSVAEGNRHTSARQTGTHARMECVMGGPIPLLEVTVVLGFCP
jgi:hypothetical protein